MRIAKEAKTQRDKFNHDHQIGQPVFLVLDSGEAIETYLRSKAWIVGRDSVIAKVEGKRGGWDTSRIRHRSES